MRPDQFILSQKMVKLTRLGYTLDYVKTLLNDEAKMDELISKGSNPSKAILRKKSAKRK